MQTSFCFGPCAVCRRVAGFSSPPGLLVEAVSVSCSWDATRNSLEGGPRGFSAKMNQSRACGPLWLNAGDCLPSRHLLEGLTEGRLGQPGKELSRVGGFEALLQGSQSGRWRFRCVQRGRVLSWRAAPSSLTWVHSARREERQVSPPRHRVAGPSRELDGWMDGCCFGKSSVICECVHVCTCACLHVCVFMPVCASVCVMCACMCRVCMNACTWQGQVSLGEQNILLL